MAIEITIRPGEGALSRAIDELPDNGESAVIRLAPGEYREKVALRRPHTALIGSGADCTAIIWDDGAKVPMPDGLNRGIAGSQPKHPAKAPDISRSRRGCVTVGMAVTGLLVRARALVGRTSALGRRRRHRRQRAGRSAGGVPSGPAPGAGSSSMPHPGGCGVTVSAGASATHPRRPGGRWRNRRSAGSRPSAPPSRASRRRRRCRRAHAA